MSEKPNLSAALMFSALQRPSAQKMEEIGRFFYEFSSLEFTIKYLLSRVTNMEARLFDTLTAPLDFSVACTSLLQASKLMLPAERAASLKVIISKCRSLNDDRVRIAHGFWMIDADGDLYARHVARGSLEANKHFAGPEALRDLAKEAGDRQRELMNWLYPK